MYLSLLDTTDLFELDTTDLSELDTIDPLATTRIDVGHAFTSLTNHLFRRKLEHAQLRLDARTLRLKLNKLWQMEKKLKDTLKRCSSHISQRDRWFVEEILQYHSGDDLRLAGPLDRIFRETEAFTENQWMHSSRLGIFHQFKEHQERHKNELDSSCQEIESGLSRLQPLKDKLDLMSEAFSIPKPFKNACTVNNQQRWVYLKSMWLELFRCFNYWEHPNRCRPPCTTMPWNIWPPLLVLWGVCWMFYTPLATPQPDDASVYLDVDFDLLDVDLLPNRESSK
jgi:hypothetical protein